MEYEQLKVEVKQIAEIAAAIPEPFREKCFELLLASLIAKEHPKEKTPKPKSTPESEENEPNGHKNSSDLVKSDGGSSTFPMTTQLRLLMRKTTVTKEDLDKILMYEPQDGGQVHFVKEPQSVAVTVGQIEWALLLALKNALLKDSLSVDPEDVRSVCQEKGFYDSANFAAGFKRANYAKLFKGQMLSQGEAQLLTNEGQESLGKLIKRLASESQ